MLSTWSGGSVLFAASCISATTTAMCGAAIDVPDMQVKSSRFWKPMLQAFRSLVIPSGATTPVLERAETMRTPGAVMSGCSSGAPGTPREEKPASTGARPDASTHCDTELVGSSTNSLHPAATLITHGATE